jgi:hypothetical protein
MANKLPHGTVARQIGTTTQSAMPFAPLPPDFLIEGLPRLADRTVNAAHIAKPADGRPRPALDDADDLGELLFGLPASPASAP